MHGAMRLFTVLVTAALMGGCAVNRATANVDATADLDKIKTVHVSKPAQDERGINVIIADKLRTKGLNVTTGPGKPESGIDAVVTYVDKWTWDITMYMLELTITIRDPMTEYPLATGNSYHTSLTRKSPKEMVDEVVDNIYKGGE